MSVLHLQSLVVLYRILIISEACLALKRRSQVKIGVICNLPGSYMSIIHLKTLFSEIRIDMVFGVARALLSKGTFDSRYKAKRKDQSMCLGVQSYF